MTALSHAPRATFQEQIVDQLGREICTGIYRPGDILPSEAELCLRFQLSRIVIREAIKALVAKGMLEVRRKAGTQVLPPGNWNLFDPDIIAWRALNIGTDPQMSRDLLELRRIVEPATARLAARRASAEQRAALRQAYAEMERAVASQGDYISADLAFHTTLLAAAGNQFLGQMQGAMAALLQTNFQIVTRKPGGPAHSLPMHATLCEAIVCGDEAAAEAAAVRLIEQSEADLIEQLTVAPAHRG